MRGRPYRPRWRVFVRSGIEIVEARTAKGTDAKHEQEPERVPTLVVSDPVAMFERA